MFMSSYPLAKSRVKRFPGPIPIRTRLVESLAGIHATLNRKMQARPDAAVADELDALEQDFIAWAKTPAD